MKEWNALHLVVNLYCNIVRLVGSAVKAVNETEPIAIDVDQKNLLNVLNTTETVRILLYILTNVVGRTFG